MNLPKSEYVCGKKKNRITKIKNNPLRKSNYFALIFKNVVDFWQKAKIVFIFWYGWYLRSNQDEQIRKEVFVIYYMASSRKDWELANSRIWLAEIDIDRGLDFPI